MPKHPNGGHGMSSQVNNALLDSSLDKEDFEYRDDGTVYDRQTKVVYRWPVVKAIVHAAHPGNMDAMVRDLVMYCRFARRIELNRRESR
jgi:hypothetical protein